MRRQTITIKVTYDESLDDAPETWPLAQMFDLQQEGEGVEVLAAGKIETVDD